MCDDCTETEEQVIKRSSLKMIKWTSMTMIVLVGQQMKNGLSFM